jgi:predicted nucleic acid-binding protein
VYCFDTDVLSIVLRGRASNELTRRLALVPSGDQFTTSITLGEMLYGARKRSSEDLAERIEALVERLVAVLPFDRDAARMYGSIRAELELAGKRIDEPDLRIASIALAHDLTLVTGNTKHFGRVPELRVENWLAS